jgi:integrase
VNLDTGEVRIRQQLQLVDKRLVVQQLKTEKSHRTHLAGGLHHGAQDAPDPAEGATTESRRALGRDGTRLHDVSNLQGRKGQHLRVGAGLHPRNVLGVPHRLLDDAKLPRVRFHDRRHSAASLLIASGVELIEVSQFLGHSELRVTADLYSHLQKQTAAKAATIMDVVLGANR